MTGVPGAAEDAKSVATATTKTKTTKKRKPPAGNKAKASTASNKQAQVQIVPEVSTRTSLAVPHGHDEIPPASPTTSSIIHPSPSKKGRKTKKRNVSIHPKEAHDDSSHDILTDMGLSIPIPVASRKSDFDTSHNFDKHPHRKDSIGSFDLLFKSDHDSSSFDDFGTSKQSTSSEKQDYAKECIDSFRVVKILLLIFGHWPYKIEEDHKGYLFQFTWKSGGFIMFIWTCLFNFAGLIISGVNVVDILMKDKLITNSSLRTPTQIIEQGLVERHTMLVIIMLGSYGLNFLTSLIIYSKRAEIADLFTKWTKTLAIAKLHTGSRGANRYVGPTLVNYLVVNLGVLLLAIFRVSATFTGGPTVISILLTRFFFPDNYLQNGFTGSAMHYSLHGVGLFLYFYVTFTTNISMYLFLWLVKSIKNAIRCWNERLSETLEVVHQLAEEVEEEFETFEAKERMNFIKLYNDHIGIVRMLKWFNNFYAGILEPWLLFITVRVVYQIYLAALVLQGNGKPLNKQNLGKYFRRQRDYIPAFLITYQNIFMVVTVLLASAWMEDAAYDSYDELREVSLLKGPSSDKESFFMLSMFQSYISTTKAAVYAGDYFSVNRYTVLHFLSAVMSNFLVVYQFRPLFDAETTKDEYAREIIGGFLTGFENLPRNHLDPVSDAERYKASS